MPKLSTGKSPQSRNDTLTISVSPSFTLEGVRALATDDPAMLDAASAWAKRWHPRTTLARAA